MHRHNAPRALHHELNGETADHEKRETRRKNPQRNQQDAGCSTQNNRATTAPFLREMADYRSTADCTESVNDPSGRLLRDSVVALFAEKRLIQVLRPMRHRVERGH